MSQPRPPIPKKETPGTGRGGVRLLTESERRRIRDAKADGVSISDLCSRFGVGDDRIKAVVRGDE